MMDSNLDSGGGFAGDNPYPGIPQFPNGPQLPPGWVRNPDGTITIPPGPGTAGGTVPAPPAGGTIDPTTGAMSYGNGGGVSTAAPNAPDDFLPGGRYGIQQPGAPVTGGTDGGGGSTFGQGGASAGGSGFDFPQFNPSIYQPGPAFNPGQFSAPAPFSYGDFNYDSFKAPTLAEAQNQPGYQFALQNGQKALENSAAARGVLRTGGTLKDLFSWGDKFGEQNYGNVFNQDLQGYTTNRANAFDTYNTNRNNAADAYRTNYGVSKDVFDTNYGTSKDAYTLNNQSNLNTYDRLFQAQSAAFNPNFQAATLKFSDLYNRDRDKLNALTGLAGLGA